jgi:NAD(P)-dependent dehydrogenase (short-subunit alcohol dehydrogenase family)
MPGVLENSITFPALDKIPAGRLGTLHDIAGAVRYLVSLEADYVTGSYIQVGGGWNL